MKIGSLLLSSVCLLMFTACGGETSTDAGTSQETTHSHDGDHGHSHESHSHDEAHSQGVVTHSHGGSTHTHGSLDKSQSVSGKHFAPIAIQHRLVGTPAVGQPLTVDIDFISEVGSVPIAVSYRIPDTTAIEMAQDQLREVSIAPAGLDEEGRDTANHQVTVIPMREGRIYLNVSAEVDTPEGRMSTVMAIPLQVGQGPRSLQENGTVIETESGELIRSLPATQ